MENYRFGVEYVKTFHINLEPQKEPHFYSFFSMKKKNDPKYVRKEGVQNLEFGWQQSTKLRHRFTIPLQVGTLSMDLTFQL